MSESLIPLHLRWLRAGGAAERTIEAKTLVLRRADRELPRGLDAATQDDLEAHMDRPKWAPATRHACFVHLNGYFVWGVDNDHRATNPMARLRRPRVPRRRSQRLSDEILGLVLDQAGEPWRTVVMIAAYAGLRVSEIAQLDREDVTAEHILVRGKGGHVDLVDTSPILWEYLAIGQRPVGPLIRFGGKPIDGRALAHRQRELWSRLGIEGVTLHRFRHWYATTLLENGADIRVVQELMRHASLATTQTYTAVVDARKRAAVRLLPPVGPSRPVTGSTSAPAALSQSATTSRLG